PLIGEGTIVAVATPAKAAGTLYVGGRGFGVIRSQDGGASWRRLNRGLPARKLEALAAHAELATTLYASVAGDGIYSTEDGGESWKRMDGGPGAQVGQLFHSNLAGSMKTGWLYAGTPDGVQRTMDCFCGWRPAGTLLGQSGSYSVVFDPDEPRTLYASGGGGLFRSRDGGENWERLPSEGAQTVALAFDPAAEILYAATREGVILDSRDQGAHWERVGE
ncbi:MAG: WD40/YVTN/BNR-like repeat-containing protein, partial [Candidatus Methylomirabilales bacterium]